MGDLALAAVAGTVHPQPGRTSTDEDDRLREVLDDVLAYGPTLADVLDYFLQSRPSEDRPLFTLAAELRLSVLEVLTVALATKVEHDLVTGRLLAHIQAPVGGSRPCLGLIARAFASAFGGSGSAIPTLLNGAAFHTGLLLAPDEQAPVAERAVRVPNPICLALEDYDGRWPGGTVGLEDDDVVPLPESALREIRRHGAALGAHEKSVLVIRARSMTEGRNAAAAIAQLQDRRPVFLPAERLAGIGPWLLLRKMLPVFCMDLTPGEVRRVPSIPGYRGPSVVLCGPDGSVETATGGAASWALDVPSRDERCTLWQVALRDAALAREVGGQFRHGAGRIAHLGRLAHHYASMEGRKEPTRDDILQAAWTGEGGGLDALAEPLRMQVPDGALVMTSDLRRNLDALLVRCRMRDDLASGLGISTTTRYRPGLRALFTGASGTGKTLAAGWIATRLSLPLYRVDLASVTSKYIGETEKNLSQLLARAEQAEVILLFDEADSLFGKRTDVSDSNDRFANAQTNYLLQRIESYDGIVLLTSNSQSRFDPAFTRRLDFTIEFPPPGPEERRSLWLAHLGPNTALTPAELNQLAVELDMCGGHIRNAVLAAAATARDAGRDLTFGDVLVGVAFECRKTGRQVPLALRDGP